MQQQTSCGNHHNSVQADIQELENIDGLARMIRWSKCRKVKGKNGKNDPRKRNARRKGRVMNNLKTASREVRE